MPNHLFPSEIHLDDLSKDSFKRSEFADKVLNNILTKMELPNTLGIYGNWGSGKTTFLHFLRRKIEEDTDLSKKIHVVHFEPWKYEYSESSDLLFALLKEIQTSFNLTNDDSWTKLSSLVIGMGGYALNEALSKLTLGIIDPLKAKDTINAVQEELKSTNLKAFEEWHDKFNEIQNAFKRFITNGLKASKKKSIFIFIDDLDRCLPERTIHLLESIKNFLYQSNSLFIFALDHRVVSEMVEKKYDLHDGYGNEYLEKIINYQISLPNKTLESLLQTMLDLHQITLDKNTKNSIVSFIDEYYREPRRAKKIINHFCMLKYLSNAFEHHLNDQTQCLAIFLALYLKENFKNHFCQNINYTQQKIKHIVRYHSYKNLASGEEQLKRLKQSDNTFTELEISKILNVLTVFKRSLPGPIDIDSQALLTAFLCIENY